MSGISLTTGATGKAKGKRQKAKTVTGEPRFAKVFGSMCCRDGFPNTMETPVTGLTCLDIKQGLTALRTTSGCSGNSSLAAALLAQSSARVSSRYVISIVPVSWSDVKICIAKMHLRETLSSIIYSAAGACCLSYVQNKISRKVRSSYCSLRPRNGDSKSCLFPVQFLFFTMSLPRRDAISGDDRSTEYQGCKRGSDLGMGV